VNESVPRKIVTCEPIEGEPLFLRVKVDCGHVYKRRRTAKFSDPEKLIGQEFDCLRCGNPGKGRR
jgi:hypothetical protein